MAVMPSVGVKSRYMTMKKKYISPEVEVIEMGLDDGILNSVSNMPGSDEETDDFSREDYHRPNRPSSGNIWDQGW